MSDQLASNALRYEVLGPLRVWLEGAELVLGPAQQRRVLAVLLLHANKSVSREQLIDAVWGTAVPARAVNLLQRNVSALRRLLEPHRAPREPSEILTWTDAGYLLTVSNGQLDLLAFERAAEQARAARAAGDLPEAAKALHGALRLWRGRLCEGLAGPLLDTERYRLEEQRLGVVEQRIEMDLALGVDVDLVGELRRLIAAHPLHERLHGLLMRALHRSGRQAEALQVYQEARRLLNEELGVEPGVELRRTQEQILAADAVLDPPATTRPAIAAPAREDGRYATSVELDAVGNLPTELTSFVGRQRELAEARRLLSTARLVTFTGVGGVGKTRLGLRAARDLQSAFRDGVWLVELTGLSDPGLIAHTVAAALDIHDQTSRGPLAALIAHLQDRRVLLILDNCEHLLNACALLVGTLLRAATNLQVIVTSRQPLAIDGEHILPVPPLWVPPVLGEEPEPEGDAAAITLFAHRAQAAVPGGFSILPENQATVTQICQRLDGIPLAIELAAVRLRALSPEQLLARLDDRFRVLTTSRRTALPHHQTLQAMVDWSFHLCTDSERLLWARLSTFTDTFDLEAAEAVCAGDDLSAEKILDLIDGLVDKSVLIREAPEEGIRFRLLETLRQYGQERLCDVGLQTALQRRHRDWYLALAEQGESEWFGPRQGDWAGRMRLEHSNLRQALNFCLTAPHEGRAGARLAAALHFFWVGCGHVEEAQHWLDRALTFDPEPSRERAKALWVASRIAYLRGNIAESVARSEECRMLARQLGDDVAMAYGTHMSGAAALLHDDPHRARLLLEDALARYAVFGELNSVVIMAQVQLAMANVFLGEPSRAVKLCRETRDTCDAHDEKWTLAYALYVQAFAEWAKGHRAVAARHARECLCMKQNFRDSLGIAMIVDLLGWIAAADGESYRAAVLLGAAEAGWNTIGLPWFGSTYWRAPHDEGARRARNALGHVAFEAAFGQGVQLPPDQVIALALKEGG